MSIGVGLPLLVIGTFICLYTYAHLSMINPSLSEHDYWVEFFKKLFVPVALFAFALRELIRLTKV